MRPAGRSYVGAADYIYGPPVLVRAAKAAKAAKPSPKYRVSRGKGGTRKLRAIEVDIHMSGAAVRPAGMTIWNPEKPIFDGAALARL